MTSTPDEDLWEQEYRAREREFALRLRNIDTLGGNARITPDGKYRYFLTRYWGQIIEPKQRVTFVMLNPSKADASTDDNTIRRCVSFAKTWGYDGLAVVNLFAFRSSDPKDLLTADDPVGPENAEQVQFWCSKAGLVVAAWGASYPKGAGYYVSEQAARLRRKFGANVLGLTKNGDPRHPLYLPSDTKPVKWVLR